MVTYHFYCFFRKNAWWKTFRESFKKIYRELFFLRNHLKSYLKEMRADDGETLHGFRSGCAITLALTGADLSEIMDHVGWTR